MSDSLAVLIGESEISLTVNGESVSERVPVRRNLADFLRLDLGLTGTHVGCEHGVCGACTIRLDGRIVRSCLILAIQTDGKRVDTIEGLSDDGHFEDLKAAFHARNGLQCGFCTPGILLTAAELIETHPDANREQIRVFLSGNYCRCTGYHAIVDAIESVVRSGQEKREP